MRKGIFNSRPFIIVLISIFAALDSVVRLVPVTYAVGLYKFFSLGWVFSPFMGVLIGPIASFAAATLGSLIRASIAPYKWTFGPFSPFLPAVSALQAGLLTQRRHKTLLPILAFTLLLSFTLTWLLFPTGRIVWPVALYYVAGLAMIPIVQLCLRISDKWLIVALILVAYVSNITQHALGNILSVWLLNVPAEIFWTALPFTLVEQTAFALASGVLTLSILFVLQKANLLQYLKCDIFKKENDKQ